MLIKALAILPGGLYYVSTIFMTTPFPCILVTPKTENLVLN